jgi:hypothetical protein
VWPDIFLPFLEVDRRWGFSRSAGISLAGISLADVAELYGLFKAAEVTDKIKIISDLQFFDIDSVLYHTEDLKHSFQQLFWPLLSDNMSGTFESMECGLWCSWQSQGPMQSFKVVPQLVSEVLDCCRNLRFKALEACCTLPFGEVERKKRLTALYRRVHDIV